MKIFIVSSSPAYVRMFEEAGFEVVDSLRDADVVQFTGGSDVDPALYGEKRHLTTRPYVQRDNQEKVVFEAALRHGKPMLGICRGAQFLNVMNDGAMYQDVDGHAIRGMHKVTDLTTGNTYQVTSTHHQMMRPSEFGWVIAVAHDVSSKKEYMPMLSSNDSDPILEVEQDHDVEVVWYPDTKCLCFQPHPEFHNAATCRSYYFNLINRYIGE